MNLLFGGPPHGLPPLGIWSDWSRLDLLDLWIAVVISVWFLMDRFGVYFRRPE